MTQKEPTIKLTMSKVFFEKVNKSKTSRLIKKNKRLNPNQQYQK